MRYFIYTDNHFSQYSSILRSRGTMYSKRLENQIQTLNWIEEEAINQKCDCIICLGDFFDSNTLNSEELTALKEIKWKGIPHYFLCGNHELGSSDRIFNSVNALYDRVYDYFTIIDKPTILENDNVYLLPYICEKDRKCINEYFEIDNSRKRILLMHNDIAGIQMGKYISKDGFSIEEIENNFDICFNGHLHNGEWITNKICNIGNITGQNFSEDGFKYKHKAIVLDTENNWTIEIENPYALNFYKLDFTIPEHNNIDYINGLKLRNAILTVKCYKDNGYECIRARFDPNYEDNGFPKNCQVIESRFIVENKTEGNIDEDKKVELKVDHIKQFYDGVVENIGSCELVLEELEKICK